MATIEVSTPHGPANVHLHAAERPIGALVLGHGAGGGVTARDLVAVTEAARAESISVALVEQPYRVAGRRSPAPAHQLDAAWTTVVDHLTGADLRRAAPRRRRTVVGGAGRLPDRRRDRRDRRALPGLSRSSRHAAPEVLRRRAGLPSSTPSPSRPSSCRACATRSGSRRRAPGAPSWRSPATIGCRATFRRWPRLSAAGCAGVVGQAVTGSSAAR